jgi:phosphosulfolactate phosphohydrolase-like enzyme
VVCAGRRLGAIPCLDDTYAAGVIVARARAAAAGAGLAVGQTDAARMACLIADAAGEPPEALASSSTSAVLRRAGSPADVAFCARTDVTDVVPVLVRGGAEARYPVVLL